MRDRTPTKVLDNGALRYGVYDASGNFLRHEYLVLDDDPTDSGTVLSKATLLKDATEANIFGGSDDRTVDDAFMGISVKLNTTIDDVATLNTKVDLIMNDVASITVTLKDSAGTAIPGVLVQGILSESGQAVYSSDSGVVSGYISEGSQTIKVTGYADIADYSETLSVTKGTSITKTITLTTRNFLKITSSQNVKFSGNVNQVDVSVSAGGGGGGYGSSGSDIQGFACGGGGGGGHTAKMTNATFSPNTSYPAVIGAGGATDADGGVSSFLGVSAEGGKAGATRDTVKSLYTPVSGGDGNGVGAFANKENRNESVTATGKNATNGTETIYSSFTQEQAVGGGGATSGYSRGTPNGGTFSNRASQATAGLSGGGAGGYTEIRSDSDGDASGSSGYPGGKGGSGCVAIRMHLRSAA